MTSFRRHVRLLAVAWLVLQGATLSAFVPRDCCKAHRPAEDAPHCAQAPVVGAAAPTEATRASVSHHAEAAPPPPGGGSGQDVVRGSCGAPPVFTLFANPGILTVNATATASASVSTPAPHGDEAPVAMSRPPADRPPRS